MLYRGLITICCVILYIFLSCAKPSLSKEVLDGYIEAKNLYIKGDLDKALEGFLAIKSKAPNFENNRFMLAKVHFFKKDYDSAISEWRTTLKLNPGHMDSVKWLSNAYLAKNMIKEAEMLTEEALASNSEDPELLLVFGRIKKLKKEYSAALEFYKKALLVREKLAEACIGSFEIYHEFGMKEQGKAELEKALALLESTSPLYKSVSVLLKELKK